MDNQDFKIFVQLLKEIADEKGISQREIADATGYQESNVSRVFSLKYTPRLDVFLNIAKAIGVNFFFEDKEGKSDLNVCLERAMTCLGRRETLFNKN